MAYKNYKIRDNWLDIDKYNDVDVQSVDGVIQNVKVNGEDVGGGGSSDFSTAQVTVIPGEDSQRSMYFPVISDDKLETQELWDGTATILLYKGSFFITNVMDIGAIASVSGDIEEVGAGHDFYYRIYGDCTITLA